MKGWKYLQTTNRDIINRMSDEAFANWVNSPHSAGLLEWLKEPVTTLRYRITEGE